MDIRALPLLFFVIFAIPGFAGEAPQKPFRRAMVLSGDNINAPLFLGMLKGAEEAGKPVDIVVTSCGGSIAGAIANAFPSTSERIAFVKSREFHAMLRGLETDDPSLIAFGGRLLRVHSIANQNEKALYAQGLGPRRLPDDLFDYSLIKIGQEFERFAEFNHAPRAAGIRFVSVAARVEFGVHASPAKGILDYSHVVGAEKKLFSEVFFTDPETAGALQGMPSLVGSIYPQSSLYAETDVITSESLANAVRASISDPLLVQPARIDGRYYMTGAVNIDPVNIASTLADEVIGRYTGLYDTFIETPALMATFAFPANELRGNVMGSALADYWIDVTGSDYPAMSPGPTLQATWNPARLMKFAFHVPENYEEYVRLADAQIHFGAERAKEALAQPKHSLSHIREPIHGSR